jgi:predicted esterase
MKTALTGWVALCAAAALLLAPTPALAKRKGKKAKGAGQGDYVKVDVTDPGFEGMYYTVFVPSAAKKGRSYPLVFALHGNGAKSDGHVRSIARVSTNDHPVFVCAPQYQKGYKFNDPRYDGWDAKFHEILDAVIAKYPIDTGRLFLQGFSMGGMYSCMWTHGQNAGDPEKYRFHGVWLNGTAVPPIKPAPNVPYVLMVGERETAVKGTINVTKMTRETYRAMIGKGFDVRYHEIPAMGHSVNEDCIGIMRDFVAGYPAFGESVPPTAKVPDTLEPMAAACRRGDFWGALDKLKGIRAIGSGASASERAAAGKLAKSAEAWLVKYAKAAPKHLEGTRSPIAYDAFIQQCDLLAGNPTVGPELKAARAKVSKSKKLAPEIQARELFEKALRESEKDAAAGRASMETLAKGSLKKTVFGQRAAQHVQAFSDEYWSK